MTSTAANDLPLPATGRDFFGSLRSELEMRARMLLAGASRHREGQLTPDDLVQECLGKLLASYDEASLRERPHNQLMALAYRTMKNLVIDAGRKKAAVLADEASSRTGLDKKVELRADPDARTPEEELAHAGRMQAMREALGGLSPEERCFVTCVIETDSVPAAQKKCGWPDKSPYYVLKKLFERLRGVIGEWAP
ncbi:MAG: sigma-70 family RNA polymerase sigma factor [Deltaproteobacteria bacterium]|nr:sigma-70 family RNA polymerase sigma factor [Deltaproteobacteria bacterium]